MIVKISTGNGWRFIDDVDDAFVYDTTIKDEGHIDCPTQWMTIREHPGNDVVGVLKVLKLITNNEIKARIIIDTNAAYLMSDAGKTIERIN